MSEIPPGMWSSGRVFISLRHVTTAVWTTEPVDENDEDNPTRKPVLHVYVVGDPNPIHLSDEEVESPNEASSFLEEWKSWIQLRSLVYMPGD